MNVEPAPTGPPQRRSEVARTHAASLPIGEVLAAVETDLRPGLSDEEAARRRARAGANALPEGERRTALLAFLGQLKSPIILLLFGAAAVALLIGAVHDAIGISAVAFLNAALGTWQEARAERSLRALKQMLSPTATVRRDGQVHQVATGDVVVGDVLLLEAGARVAADGRVAVAESLEIDESALTGESVPVAKQRAPVEQGAPLGDRFSMVHMNTLVTRGRGEVVVTAVGAATEVGRISSELAAEERPTTPIARKLASLSRRLALAAILLVALFFVVGLARDFAWGDLLLESIALAAAIIPEGLPTVVTVTLALGMRRMAKKRAIVKQLASVETLGSTTVICSDKTGTLTENRMAVVEAVTRGGRHRDDALTRDPDVRRALAGAVLCSDARRAGGALVGDPTETALIEVAERAGIDVEQTRAACPRVGEVPFDAAHRYMATFHEMEETDGRALVRLYLKGAAESVLPLTGGAGEARWNAVADELAAAGYRVLAIATRVIDGARLDPAGDAAALRGLVDEVEVIGLLALEDPVRVEAKESVTLAREAGIDVKVVTGDHPGTALAVVQRLGLSGSAVTGKDLERMSDEELARRVDDIAVFARVAPEHKVRIVRVLQREGHVVAMTGDGVNDAPALKAADIGVAMGRGGTEVAKEAAALVLTDDNFATIVTAVHQGRTIYDNILKFVRFQLGTATGALLAMFIAPLLGLPAPFTPLQILWINVIMDGPPAMALGLEPADKASMRLPPRRKDESILPWPRLLRVVLLGATMGGIALGVLGTSLARGASTAHALTLTFTCFVLFQVANALGSRVEGRSALGRVLFTNRALWLALLVVVVLQAIVVYAPFAQRFFRTTPLSLADWGLAAALTLVVLAADELIRLALRPVQRRRPAP